MAITIRQAQTIIHALHGQARREETAIARLKKSGGKTRATSNALEHHLKALADVRDAMTPIADIIDAHADRIMAKLTENQ